MNTLSYLQRRLGATLLVAVALLWAGCQIIGPDSEESEPRTELERNRAAWQSVSNGDYEYVLMRSCFCIHAGRYQITVADYEIVSVSALDRPEEVPVEDYEIFATVEQMFDLVLEAREGGADTVEVEYADLGYPTRIQLDYSAQIADDELFLAIESMAVPRPLPQAE